MIEIERVPRKTPRNPWHMRFHPFFRSNFVHKFADTVARAPYSTDDLITSLSNSIKLREAEIRGKLSSVLQTFLGRRRDEINHETIVIDGMRLQQLFALAGQQGSEPIADLELYRLRLAVLRELVDAVKMKDRRDDDTCLSWRR